MGTLYARILRAFVLIVVLAVVLSVAIGYYVTQSQLEGFVAQLAAVEAENVARQVGREYTASGGWETVDVALAEAGYLYAGEGEHEGGNGERRERREGGEETAFHIDRIRIVVVTVGGAVIRDNLSRLQPGSRAPALGGERATVIERGTGRTVGYAYVDVEREYLATELHGFLRGMLGTTAVGGVLIAVVALGLAAWIARRITAPVTLLTTAAKRIEQGEDSALLPVTSTDELGQMSEAFNRMTNSLQAQRDVRRRLINDLSHELNTPLAVIRLEAQGLRDGLQEPGGAAELIIGEVTLLANLVRDLNWLAETDSGDLRLSRETVAMELLLESELQRWQPQARIGGIGLKLEAGPGLPVLEVDPMRMSQALGNVVQNALQHTEAGGRITIAGAATAEGGMTITVTDDGAGIASEDLPHVFDRLYRSDEARTRGSGGSGLGLSIAGAIVSAHSGTVTITSGGLGQGTKVSIALPGKVATSE